MAFALSFSLALGTSQTGLSLKAALVSSAGTIHATLRDISAGFTEVGAGNYLFYTASIPDDYAGGAVFYTGTLGAAANFSAVTVKASAPINEPVSAIAGDVTVLPVVSTVSAGLVTSHDLSVYQFASWSFLMAIVDSGGEPVDLSGETDSIVMIVYHPSLMLRSRPS